MTKWVPEDWGILIIAVTGAIVMLMMCIPIFLWSIGVIE